MSRFDAHKYSASGKYVKTIYMKIGVFLLVKYDPPTGFVDSSSKFDFVIVYFVSVPEKCFQIPGLYYKGCMSGSVEKSLKKFPKI